MEIVGRTLRERLVQAAIVFILLLAFDLYQNTVDVVAISTAAISFFVILIVLDAARIRILGR